MTQPNAAAERTPLSLRLRFVGVAVLWTAQAILQDRHFVAPAAGLVALAVSAVLSAPLPRHSGPS